MHLITHGSDHAAIYTRNSRFTEDESKRHKKQRFVRTEINFVLGKNGGYMPSSLGGRPFVVVRQADENLAVNKKFKIR